MKIAVVGQPEKQKSDGVALINKKAGRAVTARIPRGLEVIYSERRNQAKAGGGKMIDSYAARRGLTQEQAIDEINAKADSLDEFLDNIENVRQSAITDIKLSVKVADIDAIIEGLTFNG